MLRPSALPTLKCGRSLPLAMVTATAYYGTTKIMPKSDEGLQPLQFIPSGEPHRDSERLELIRQDWRERNKGIGLRDVK
ncbi:hypothetical protein BX666DRAFT_2025453 [Dichotomocladium elegans]|nr:hypothetical protein BX666DRAFT_2025453 [Dichotomocladium elegans]